MRASIFENAGNPEDVLKIKELEMPVPPSGHIRIKVKASPINPSDTMFVRGLYGIRPQLPSPAGFEGVGIVDALGEGVDMPLGTRVMFTTVGAWAEYAIVNAKMVSPCPDHLSDEVAAQSFVNPLTAWAMLHDANLASGDWLILTAGGSTFSQLVIQMTKAKGIKTIATVRRNDQIEQLKSLGATEVVNTEEVNLVKRVKEITNGEGASACFEAVGGKTASEALKSLKMNGLMLIYGLLSLENGEFDSGLMIFKNLTVKGFWLTAWLQTATSEAKAMMRKEVYSNLGGDSLQLVIEAKYPLSEIAKAVKHADTPGRKGKILIVNE